MATKNKKATSTKSSEVASYNDSSFLPDGYRIPKKADQFMKFAPGNHLIRIMTEPLKGFVFFAEKEENGKRHVTPVRRSEEFGDFSVDELIAGNAKITNGKIEGSKYFWVLLIYDYAEKRFKVLELTQLSLLEPIVNLYKHEKYGDPRGYDITVTRVGTTMSDTEYSVIPSPPEKLSKEIFQKFEALKYNINAVLDGGYPLS